jgi:hypothetical protein
MPITATAEPGVESSLAQTRSSRFTALTNDDRLMDLRLRDPHSSKNMVALSVGGR